MMSSIGVIVATSFIFAEFTKSTHFGKWNEVKDPNRKVILFFVWFSFLSVLILDAMMGLQILLTIPSVVDMFTDELISQISFLAGSASVFVLIPMIITTFLFYQGFVGVAVIYIILMWILSLLFELIRLILVGIIMILVYGLPYLIEFILRLLVFIIIALLFIVGYIFMGTGISLKTIIPLIRAIFNVIYLPMDVVIECIHNIFKK